MSRIIVLVNEYPREGVINRIKERHPNGKIEVFRWTEIRHRIFHFIHKQRRKKPVYFYILSHELITSNQLPYLMAFSLLFRAKHRKVITSKGTEIKCSWGEILLNQVPIIIGGAFMSLFFLLLNLMVVEMLFLPKVMRTLQRRCKGNYLYRPVSRKKSVGFFWSELPGNRFDYKVGGEISHIVGFFSGLESMGYTGFTVTTRPIYHSQFKAQKEIVDEKKLPQWPGEVRQMAYNWKVLLKSTKMMQKWQPSLIYQRTSEFSYIGVLLSIFYRIPMILEINSPVEYVEKTWGGVRFRDVSKKTEIICIAYANKIAVVSTQVRDYLVKQGISCNKIIVNPNGVDPEFFSPNGQGKKIVERLGLSAKIIVGFIGSFNPYHGVLTLAQAIKPVVNKFASIHFIIMGEGKLRPEFENIILSDKMSSYITLTGKVPHEEVPDLMDACDILVSPHQNMEDGSTFYGSPTKIFEYMAMGKGIVASDVGQLGEILQHEVTALLVKPGEPKELAEGIIRLARDDVLRKALGEKAREHVVSSFTWKQNAERIVKPFFGGCGGSL